MIRDQSRDKTAVSEKPGVKLKFDQVIKTSYCQTSDLRRPCGSQDPETQEEKHDG